MEHQKELAVFLKQDNNGRKNFYCQEIADKQPFESIRKRKISQSHAWRRAGNTEE